MEIPLHIRELEPADLPELAWSGGPEHLRAIAHDLGRAAAGEVAQLLVVAANGVVVGFGAVDLTREADAGRLWMLSIRDSWQSLGIGSLLVHALEDRVADAGRSYAAIAVEHDNPRARALYLRLGYRPYASELDTWATSPSRTYVTVTEVLRRALPPRPRPPGSTTRAG